MIKKGDVITFKEEWAQDGDEEFTFRAIEDEDGGRVKVRAEGTGLFVDPVSVVLTDWIALP